MRTELNVKGMTCDGCSRQIETVLSRLSGVRGAQVDHRSGHASIEHTDEVEIETLTTIVESLGYEVTPGRSAGGDDREPGRSNPGRRGD